MFSLRMPIQNVVKAWPPFKFSGSNYTNLELSIVPRVHDVIISHHHHRRYLYLTPDAPYFAALLPVFICPLRVILIIYSKFCNTPVLEV